jgi:UDP-glucuronate decarboxylase
LAGIASPEKYKKYPLETLQTSINGTQNVLEVCKTHNSRLIFTSTSEIYGDPQVHPQPEEYFGNVNTVGERSCYDEGKRVCETLIYEYRKIHGLDLKIVRLFNTYGPKMDINDGRVITNFIQKIMKNEPIEIYGDGNQTRSFCYIDDMLDALIAMMESDQPGPINLGNPYCEFTLNRLVTVFENITGNPLCKLYLPSTQDDPKVRKPVIEKAVQYLGWTPKIGLTEGLQKTMEYFTNIHNHGYT